MIRQCALVVGFVACQMAAGQTAAGQTAIEKNLQSKISATGQVIDEANLAKPANDKFIKDQDAYIAYSIYHDNAVSAQMTKEEYNRCVFLYNNTTRFFKSLKQAAELANKDLATAQTALNDAATALANKDIPLAIAKHSEASKAINWHVRLRAIAHADSLKLVSYHEEWKKILSKYPLPPNN